MVQVQCRGLMRWDVAVPGLYILHFMMLVCALVQAAVGARWKLSEEGARDFHKDSPDSITARQANFESVDDAESVDSD